MDTLARQAIARAVELLLGSEVHGADRLPLETSQLQRPDLGAALPVEQARDGIGIRLAHEKHGLLPVYRDLERAVGTGEPEIETDAVGIVEPLASQ